MNKSCFILVFLFLATAIPALTAQPNAVALMPLPEKFALNPGRLAIDGSFSATLTGQTDPLLKKAVARLISRLQQRTGIPMPLQRTGTDPDNATLQIQCDGAGESVQSIRSNESYQLEVTDRKALLTAPSPIGILRGIETFLQLISLDRNSFYVPAIKIEDRPRFRWRGLHIDVSRHWEPAEVIRRNIDAMAAVKMNVLHWHLSDDQGFRVESLKFPKLQEKGSDGKYYTQAEIKEIVAYAHDRGIRVVPEFDMPGHSTSWLVGYPELASAPGPYQIERSWGVFEPCMDPTRESTYAFLESFIGEMAGLFPDEYFHTGGDEVNEKHWNSSATIKEFKARRRLKDNRELQAYFNQRLLKILSKYGKKMMGWDEVLHKDLPKNVVVQVWRRQPSVGDVIRRGFSGILSYGLYLDHLKPASFHYGMDPMGTTEAFTSDEISRILGGEACMWAEFATPDNIESRIWPRAAAIAERLWSPSMPTDIEDMYRRMEQLNQNLIFTGLRHRSNQEQMLLRLSGSKDIAPLKKFSESVQATGLSVRQRTRKYSSLSPMNRMVDAAFPESEIARQLDNWVQSFLRDPSGTSVFEQKIRTQLSLWKDNSTPLQILIEQSFLLQEVQPLAETITDLCAKGLQAMDYIQSRQQAPETWKRETGDLLARSEKPQAEMLPAITGSIKRLYEAAVQESAPRDKEAPK